MFRIQAMLFTTCCTAFLMQSNVAMAADELVTIYPTYGFQKGNEWVIPLRLWVHEKRSLADAAAVRIVAGRKDVSPEEVNNFRARVVDILADGESREVVSLAFDRDPLHEEFRPTDAKGRTPKSDLNGLIEGTITLSRERADSLLKSQQSGNGWLSLTVTSKGHSGKGRVRLISAEGLSVISDIDDTIKVTEMPAGAEIVVRNTFLRDYKVAPEMLTRYREWSDAPFHYVSGCPWQMYGPLSEFLIEGKDAFPEGSFHMKSAQTNLFSRSTWKDLTDLVANSENTFNQKVSQISSIMEHFPRRRFILVGDSGEKDPEVYRAIQTKFPEQVQEIWIRDVVNDRELNADRLEGMQIIPTATVRRGASEFDK